MAGGNPNHQLGFPYLRCLLLETPAVIFNCSKLRPIADGIQVRILKCTGRPPNTTPRCSLKRLNRFIMIAQTILETGDPERGLSIIVRKSLGRVPSHR